MKISDKISQGSALTALMHEVCGDNQSGMRYTRIEATMIGRLERCQVQLSADILCSRSCDAIMNSIIATGVLMDEMLGVSIIIK